MSVIEDTRKVMQDFLAPELRELKARLDALEKRFDGFEKRTDKRFDQIDRRFDHIDAKFDQVDGKFDDVERRAAKRHEDVLRAIGEMTDLNSMRERIAKLESQAVPRQ